MRHGNHRHQLGVKTAHRAAMLSALAVALLKHGRIQTTLAKAKALRPFIEKVITMAVKAKKTDCAAQKVHYRRLALARVREKEAVHKLFDVRADEFVNRAGGYTRIYKLVPRVGDAANIALIELIDAADEGYTKGRAKKVTKRSVAKLSDKKAAVKEVETVKEQSEEQA